jgi:hypothetical protein
MGIVRQKDKNNKLVGAFVELSHDDATNPIIVWPLSLCNFPDWQYPTPLHL